MIDSITYFLQKTTCLEFTEIYRIWSTHPLSIGYLRFAAEVIYFWTISNVGHQEFRLLKSIKNLFDRYIQADILTTYDSNID